jgi:hypothetical protein
MKNYFFQFIGLSSPWKEETNQIFQNSFNSTWTNFSTQKLLDLKTKTFMFNFVFVGNQSC